MRQYLQPLRWLSLFITLFPLLAAGRVAAEPSQPPLPPEVAMNWNAGRGGDLRIPLRLESGETGQFIVDTGSGSSLIDKSLEPKLGKRFGTTEVSMFGRNRQSSGIYAAPKLYLGNVQLLTGSKVRTYDFKGPSTHILGLLGMDCLKHYCLQWDFQARKMRFLDAEHLKAEELGQAYPLVFSRPGRPFIVHTSLIGEVRTNTPVTTREFPATHALIDSGYSQDGRVDPGPSAARSSEWIHRPECVWDSRTYTNLTLGHGENANLLGLKFLARHLVTLDFPHQRLYLKQTSVGPLPAEWPAGSLAAESRAAALFLFHLHQQGRLPGDSKDEHGEISCEDPSAVGAGAATYPFSQTFHAVVNGKTYTNHYTVFRLYKEGAWELQRAWRTDAQGRLVQEWPVK